MPATDQKKPARRAPQALAAKPVAVKPVASKPVTAAPAPSKPAVAPPVAGKAAPATPAPMAAAPDKPALSKPLVAKPIVTKPIVTKPAAPKPAVATPAPVVAASVAPAPAPVAVPKPAPLAAPAAAVLPDAAALAAGVKAVLPPEALPKAVRGVADTGLAQARDAYATLKQSAETLSSSFSTSGEATARGIKSFSATMLEHMQANADATLGFLRAMAGVKSVSEAIELQASHARHQFEAVTAQAKTLTGIVNRTATEAAEPVRKAFDASIRRAS